MSEYNFNMNEQKPGENPVQNPTPVQQYDPQSDPRYRLISSWGYVGYGILFSIPIVGFVLLIVYSLSNENYNRRNYARSYFCWLLIGLIIFGIFLAIGVATSGSLQSFLSNYRYRYRY